MPANDPTDEPRWDDEGNAYLETRLETERNSPAEKDAVKAALELGSKGKKGEARTRAGVLETNFNTQAALALRAQGWSVADIADHMQVSMATITQWFTSHRRKVAAASVDKQLDEIAVPLATENLIHGLLAKDKDYTLETLKGRGRFRRHVAQEGEVKHDLPPLVIRFEAPHLSERDPQEPKTVTGHVVGAVALPAGASTRTPVVDMSGSVGVPSAPETADADDGHD